MNKKAISTIVATVLIVLITVAAVTILWAAVSPLIDRNLESSTTCFDAQNALSIDTNVQHTCYDDDDDEISYRVERTANDIEIVKMVIYYDIDGETNSSEVDVPGPNKATKDTLTDIEEPELNNPSKVTLSVAPILIIDGEQTACEASNPVEISACPA